MMDRRTFVYMRIGADIHIRNSYNALWQTPVSDPRI